MQLSDQGAAFIAGFEGIKLVPYLDANGWATVGIGHLIRKGPVEPTDLPITIAQAYDLFRQDAKIEISIIGIYIKVPLNQNQFDSLCSLSYNIGVGNFMRSPIPSLINSGQLDQVPAAFLVHNRDAKGNVLPGLTRRREAEVALFNKLC